MNNVILDIDNTLVHSLSSEVHHTDFLYNKLTYHIDDELIVFERPGLNKFLDKLFKKYKVSIWTAGNKTYAHYIRDLLFKDRDLDFVYYDIHCKKSNVDYGDDYIQRYGFRAVKDLRYIYEKKGYTKKNTILVDDFYYTYRPQLKNVIFCDYFSVFKPNPHKDRYLNGLIDEISTRFS